MKKGCGKEKLESVNERRVQREFNGKSGRDRVLTAGLGMAGEQEVVLPLHGSRRARRKLIKSALLPPKLRRVSGVGCGCKDCQMGSNSGTRYVGGGPLSGRRGMLGKEGPCKVSGTCTAAGISWVLWGGTKIL